MKKNIALIFGLTCILFLIICATLINSKKTRDRIEVYDKNQNMILEMLDQKDINYFSKLIGNTTDNMENEDLPLVKLPKDARVSYEYRFIVKRRDRKEIEINFYVYENYQYITLKGIPVISPLTWKLSDEDYAKLKNPKN